MIAVGDEVTVHGKFATDYGYFEVKTILPKGSHGRKCQLVEVIHCTDRDFNFGLVKTFRMVDLRKVGP